jgi:hypothetical protein
MAILDAGHDSDIQAQQDDKMQHLDQVSRPRDDEPILIQKRRPSRIVQRDGSLLPVIRDDVDEAGGRIHELTAINGVDDLLARTTCQEGLAGADNGDLERRELSFHFAGAARAML